MSFADDLDVKENSEFMKLKAGEVVAFNILSRKPVKSLIHWENKKKIECTTDSCEQCQKGNKPKQRWVIDVWDRKENVVKKLEFGASIASQMKAISEVLTENGQTIHDVDLRVKTSGSGLETEYNVINVPKAGPIPQSIMDQFEVPF